MRENEEAHTKPSERLMQPWINQNTWTLEEAILLAFGVSPDDDKAEETLKEHNALFERTKHAGTRSGSPLFWLWWAERNSIAFHEQWWLAVTPQGPIGYDGKHFAFLREEMLSERYLQQERRLIGEWTRKPYWTQREAIDLSLNFEPVEGRNWRGDAPERRDTIQEREDRFLILERALEIGEITDKAPPLDYTKWLERRGYFVSEAWRRALGMPPQEASNIDNDDRSGPTEEISELRDRLKEKSAKIVELEEKSRGENVKSEELTEQISMLEQRVRDMSGEPETPTEKSAKATRIASLEKALLAAVVGGYHYDPRREISDAPKKIADKTIELGCSVSNQTIRKYLRKSADNHVDQSVWDEIYP